MSPRTPASLNPTFVRWDEAARSRSALICFPWAGAGAGPFRTWVEHLPPDLEVWAARLPGRETRIREPPINDLPKLIEMLVRDFPIADDKPYVLFGHCSGALVAFELARAIRSARPHLAGLIVAAQPPPQRMSPPSGPTPDIRQTLRQLGATPPAVLEDDELFALVEPAIRADAELCRRYLYRREKPLSAPMIVINPTIDASLVGPVDDWSLETTGRVLNVDVAAGHMFAGESWSTLCRAVAEGIAEEFPPTDRSREITPAN